jgi:hypothetical protein
MGEESTQLNLGAELDRLSAMQGNDDTDLRLALDGAAFRPEAVDGHELRALCDDGPAALRGRRVGLALHACHPDARAEVDGSETTVERLVDAVGGPDLDGYVYDRATGAVLAVRDDGDPLGLVVADSSPAGEAGAERRVAATDLGDATVPGYDDRARYRRYDAYGRRVD